MPNKHINLLGVIVGTMICLVFEAGCDSHQGELAVKAVKDSLSREKPPEKVESSRERPPEKVEQKPPAKIEEKDPEREAFIKIVKQNADDPSDLEIVLWGDKSGDMRSVRFRCKLVGHARQQIRYRLGTTPPRMPPGEPVMLENATIVYKGGKIESVSLSRTYQIWYP